MPEKLHLIMFLIIAFAGLAGGGFWYAKKEKERKKKLARKKRSAQAAVKPARSILNKDMPNSIQESRNVDKKTAQLNALKQKLEAAHHNNHELNALEDKKDGNQILDHLYSPEKIDEHQSVYQTVVDEPSSLGNIQEFKEDPLPIFHPEGKTEEVKTEGSKTPDFSIEPPSVEPVKMVKLLVVDDSKVVRAKTEKLLKAHQYQVMTAIDGLDALEKMASDQPDLIITDIDMPNMGGFELVEKIRQDNHFKDIPVIVMTSHVNLHIDIALKQGIQGFVPKPFQDQDLLDQIEFLLEA